MVESANKYRTLGEPMLKAIYGVEREYLALDSNFDGRVDVKDLSASVQRDLKRAGIEVNQEAVEKATRGIIAYEFGDLNIDIAKLSTRIKDDHETAYTGVSAENYGVNSLKRKIIEEIGITQVISVDKVELEEPKKREFETAPTISMLVAKVVSFFNDKNTDKPAMTEADVNFVPEKVKRNYLSRWPEHNMKKTPGMDAIAAEIGKEIAELIPGSRTNEEFPLKLILPIGKGHDSRFQFYAAEYISGWTEACGADYKSEIIEKERIAVIPIHNPGTMLEKLQDPKLREQIALAAKTLAEPHEQPKQTGNRDFDDMNYLASYVNKVPYFLHHTLVYKAETRGEGENIFSAIKERHMGPYGAIPGSTGEGRFTNVTLTDEEKMKLAATATRNGDFRDTIKAMHIEDKFR